jgi:carbon-monoxide dehydrogenase medium subunit
MKPPPISFSRPATLDGVLSVLGEYGDDARVLAGGQSLVPALNFRLAHPEILVDIGRAEGLNRFEVTEDFVAIGAAVTQRTVEKSPEVAAACPLLIQALRLVGHVQNRNRGTVVGSLAHADPAAELPAVALVLDASLVVQSKVETRVVPAGEFFLGAFTTALRPGELLVEARFPLTGRARTAVMEISPRSGDFAIAGVAGRMSVDASGAVADAALALFGVGGAAIRLGEAEEYLAGRPISEAGLSAVAAMASAAAGTDYGDVHAAGEYRSRVSGELTRRAVAQMAAA